MNTRPEIEQLRELNPVPEAPHDPDRAERLMRQILAEPRTRPPRGWGWLRRGLGGGLRLRIGGITVAALAAIAAAVIVGLGLSGSSSLVDRAYAAINAGYMVVHEVDVQNYGPPGFYDRTEGWLLPADGRARVIESAGYTGARYVNYIKEWIITSSGRVLGRACLTHCVVSSFVRSRSRWEYAGTERALAPLGGGLAPSILPGTFAQHFRAAYRVHAIVAEGTTTFDGRRVARFASAEAAVGTGWVDWRPGTPAPASVKQHEQRVIMYWYIDPATARPVGRRVWGCTGSCRRPGGPSFTTRIVVFQRLQPTAQNLAELTGPGAPTR